MTVVRLESSDNVQVAIPHELFVLIYDFIFEAEKKAFLQVIIAMCFVQHSMLVLSMSLIFVNHFIAQSVCFR
jgi:hypothetical protein